MLPLPESGDLNSHQDSLVTLTSDLLILEVVSNISRSTASLLANFGVSATVHHTDDMTLLP